MEKRVGECKGKIKMVETGLTKAKEDVKEEMEELKERRKKRKYCGVWSGRE